MAGVCGVVGAQIYGMTADKAVNRKIADVFLDPYGDKYPGFTTRRDDSIKAQTQEANIQRINDPNFLRFVK